MENALLLYGYTASKEREENWRGFRDYLSSVESEGSNPGMCWGKSTPRNPGEGEGMELIISENEEKLN
ncbi:hypothetical protein Q3G72_026027 [Acer saccharum]|nr:hypothetical protein Q3G72_029431 [Acer saccharum]KAK1568564.1 hypothetical protein Q3G72_026027 [Acer saccharum]